MVLMKNLIIFSMLLVSLSESNNERAPISKKNEKELRDKESSSMKYFDLINDGLLHNIELFVPHVQRKNIEGRKRKKLKLNKYVFPLIIGFLLIKSVLLPLTLKALAILSGKAVVLSLMSLILAAIVGLRTVAAGGGAAAQNKIDLVSKHKRKDILDYGQPMEDDPYRFYVDHNQ